MGVSKVAVSTGVLGSGTPVIAGTYYATQSTVKSYLYNDALPWTDEFQEQWKELQKRLKETSEEVDESIKELKSSVDSWSESTSSEDERIKQDGDLVKYWCSDIYQTTIKSLVKSEDQGLLDSAKTYCVYSMKDYIDKQGLTALSVDDESNKSDFEGKYSSLSSLPNDVSKALNSELKKLKREFKDEEKSTKWSEIKEWCKKAFSRGYRGETENPWILTKHFCTNTAAPS